MKSLIFLCFFISLVITNSEKAVRKPAPVPCPCSYGESESKGDSGSSPDCECDDPCDDCDEPRITNKIITPVLCQKVYDRTVLQCTKESYFDRIEYDGCYEWNTTCTGVQTGKYGYIPNFYKGIIVNDDCSETEEQLNAENFKYVATHIDGNTQLSGTAKLTDCKCNGDLVKGFSSWMAVDDPLTGCCDDGVNHQQATSYTLVIYGECCSECYLVQGSHSWEKPVKN